MAISKLKLPQGVSAHAFKSPVLLAESLALAVARQLGEAIEAQGTATLVVSGGRSPVAFFQHRPSRNSTGPTSWSASLTSAGCR